MADKDCLNPEEHCALHACQLTASERNPEVDKELFKDPQYICENCGAEVHKAENACRPRAL